MKLIPHHQDGEHSRREYRSPDGAWRVVRPRRRRNERPRWEVHERHAGHAGGWRCHAAFERRRDALVFLDTTAAAGEGASVTTAPPGPRGFPHPQPKEPTTHELDDTRSQDNPLIAVRRAPVRSEGERRQDGEPATTSASPASPRPGSSV